MYEHWDLTRSSLGHYEEDLRKGRGVEAAVLPTCAVEPHNRHLPQGQDWLHTTHVSREAVRRAAERDARVVWLPAIPYGVDCNLMGFPYAVHVSQATLDGMVRDVIASLRAHGVRKMVLVNGHGGNDFAPLARQIQCDLDVHVFLCDWWKVGADRYDEFFDRPDDHAGQFETSVALALFPDLVDADRAGDGRARPFRFEALERGWVRTSRCFSRLNDHCACGDPGGASAERGRGYLELVIQRIADFLVELADAAVDENFPHRA